LPEQETTNTAGSRRKALKFALRLLVTAALLFFVFKRIDLKQFGSAVKQMRYEFLAAVFLLSVFSLWVLSWRMHLILRKLDCGVAVSKVFWTSTVAILYSLVLPDIASAGVKWYILKSHAGKASNVLSSMFYNQASIIVVKVLVALAALMISNPWNRPAATYVSAAVVVLVLLLCLLLLNRRTGPKVNRALIVFLRPLPQKMRAAAEKILGQLEIFQTTSWLFHLKMAAITLFTTALGVVIYYFAARAAGIEVPVAVLIWLSAVIFILSRVPVSIANLGIREATLVGFLKFYGIEPSGALLMSVVLFSAIVFMAALGAVYQISWTFSRKWR
jgi:uncharacterized protein (TIRG00374 family)